MSLMRKAFLFILVKWMRRGNRKTENAIWMLLSSIKKHYVLLSVLVVINIIMAFIEGGAIGLISIAVAGVVSDADAVSVPINIGIDTGILDTLWSSYGKEGYFLILMAVAMAAQLIRVAISFFSVVIATILQFRITEDLQSEAVTTIMSMSFSEVSKYPSGELNANVGQATGISRLVMTVNEMMGNFFVFIIYLFLMFSVSPYFTLSTLAVIIVLSLAMNKISKVLREQGFKVSHASIASGKQIMEFFSAPKLVRVYGREVDAGNRIMDTLRAGYAARTKGAIYRGVINPLTDFVTITVSGVVLIGGYFLMKDDANNVLPLLFSFVLILNRLMTRAASINGARASFVNVLPVAEVVGELLRRDNKSFSRTTGEDIEGFNESIRFKDVTFSYVDKPVLNNIDIEIKKGSLVSFVGRSGSGKSTIIDLLTGLYSPGAGSVQIDGKDLNDISLSSWRKNIGVVSQDNYIFNDSVLNNIAFSKPSATRDEVIQAAKIAHAHEFIEGLDDGYDTFLGDRGYMLSGGQNQRISLARAILRGADVLILDEATSALDSVSERDIMDAIDELRGDITIIMIAHRLSTIVNSDNIIVLADGVITAEGTHNELISGVNTYSKLWAIQQQSS